MPHLQDMYVELCMRRADGIIKDFAYPFQDMFMLMQSGKDTEAWDARTNKSSC